MLGTATDKARLPLLILLSSNYGNRRGSEVDELSCLAIQLVAACCGPLGLTHCS